MRPDTRPRNRPGRQRQVSDRSVTWHPQSRGGDHRVVVGGFLIVADSAQFSAAVSELAEESYVGTVLTLQTAIGFFLTTVSIQLIPMFVDAVGWEWSFAPLAIGPAIGTLSMLRLRGLPDASKLAGGKK